MLFCVEHNKKFLPFYKILIQILFHLIRSLRFHTMLSFMNKNLLAYHVSLLHKSLLKEMYHLQLQSDVYYQSLILNIFK